ncbi:DNA repair RAD52-like protein 1, mitochondrial [Curcuma longa]|uniref:DNA repair RAD52-like protein 1, mitochondrial n=1 Tax=Curcuma longa TaxID=136217 RepID=UPI003D9DECFB
MASWVRTRSLLPRRASRYAASPSTSPSRFYAAAAAFARSSSSLANKAKAGPPLEQAPATAAIAEDDDVPTSGISRPLSEILKELNKKIPEPLISTRVEGGVALKYVPWHFLNRILNVHAPEWSGEIRSIVYSADGSSVHVVYRITLYGTDAEIYREATGTAAADNTSYGDPVQKAEAMAFRRACARLGLGLHLYYEDAS